MKKNLFMLTITGIIASILFSSCSITKRRYTSGYYVSHSSGKQTTANKVQEPIAQKKTNPSLYTLQNLPQENSVSSEAVQTPGQEKSTITASNKQVVSKTNTPRLADTHTKHALYQLAIITPEKKESSSFANKKVSADRVANDALSLFWIIILILLILWLVAILTGGWGLGGFIHLLLLIALILLILWLLRII